MHTKQPLCYWLLLAPCALPDTLSPPTFRSCHHYRLPLRPSLWASNSISNPVLYILTTRTYLHLQTHARFFTSYHNTTFTRAQLHTECSIDNKNHQPVITLNACIYLTFTPFLCFWFAWNRITLYISTSSNFLSPSPIPHSLRFLSASLLFLSFPRSLPHPNVLSHNMCEYAVRCACVYESTMLWLENGWKSRAVFRRYYIQIRWLFV